MPPEHCQQGEEVSLPFQSGIWDAGASSEPPIKEQLDILEIVYLQLMILAYKHLSLQQNYNSSAWRKLRVDLSNVCKYLTGR